MLLVAYCGIAAGQVMVAAQPVPLKLLYDEEAKTSYCVVTRDSLLTVQLWVADAAQQVKILQNGLELWVDVKGRQHKTTGIMYPLPVKPTHPFAAKGSAMPQQRPEATGGETPADAARETMPQNKQRVPAQALQAMIASQKEIQLRGFGEELNGFQNQHHPSGLDVSLRLFNDTLYYRAQIPLRLLAGFTGINQRMSIGIIEKGKEPKEFEGNMPGMGGPPPGGGEGMGPGGPPPGGGAPPDMEAMQQLFATNVFWYKFVVSR
jgi:hypothetical protein